MLLPHPVRALATGEPPDRLAGGRATECAKIIELSEPEAGGVDRRDVAVPQRRPATLAGLPKLGLVDHVLRWRHAGAEPTQPRTVDGVTMSDDVPDRGVEVRHGRTLTHLDKTRCRTFI